MRTIYRYEITEIEYRHLQVEPGYKPIRVDEINGVFSMWAEVDTDKTVIHHIIRRVQLPVQEKFTIALPQSAKIIHAQDHKGLFYLWYIYEATDENKAAKDRKLVFFKTGQPIPDDMILSPLIGTCKLFIMQELCLYLFSVIEDESA